MSGTAWPEDQIKALHDLTSKRVGDAAIARVLGRSVFAVAKMRRKLGIKKPPPPHKAAKKPGAGKTTTPRNCMTCGRQFNSEGPGHRLCSEHRNQSVNPFEFGGDALA